MTYRIVFCPDHVERDVVESLHVVAEVLVVQIGHFHNTVDGCHTQRQLRGSCQLTNGGHDVVAVVHGIEVLLREAQHTLQGNSGHSVQPQQHDRYNNSQ